MSEGRQCGARKRSIKVTSRQRGLAHVFFRRAAALRRVQGPKRYTGLPCRIEDVPEVDVVAISHNQYNQYVPSSSAVAHDGLVGLSNVTARLVCPTFLGVRQRFGSFYLAMIPIRCTNRDIRVDYTLRTAG
ncbi:hypothetical protein ARMGADRAFT_434058 [Armillaria gallica]|uniref:Uncharacterized protein n=1 Tax=Armillaria gallica TaxID=47427 RepID=A0A2H3D317_ARMGA|nr:hypothetical protein ARMGADRAFT_434058 [Armillaria gallica]